MANPPTETAAAHRDVVGQAITSFRAGDPPRAGAASAKMSSRSAPQFLNTQIADQAKGSLSTQCAEDFIEVTSCTQAFFSSDEVWTAIEAEHQILESLRYGRGPTEGSP